MRTRLRPAHDEQALARMYAAPHQHDLWPDHVARVDETIALGRELFRHTVYPAVIADLSCGDGAIARALGQVRGSQLILGDLAPGREICGPIEQTLVSQLLYADLFICTETIEHLDDPDTVLALARERAGTLLLSTPLGEDDIRVNAEHYWGWDHDGVRAMLTAAGWLPVLQRDVSWLDGNGHAWAYQIWGCR